MIKRRDIIFEARDWTGSRKVRLLKSTLKEHVLRFHYDSAFVVDSLKRNLSTPICVIRNKKNDSENAIFSIPVGGHPLLLVAIRYVKGVEKLSRKGNLILTFYGIEKDEIPRGTVCWGVKP